MVAAATLADRYINDRFLPDKAIDLIDEAGARMRIRRMTAPPDLREFDEKIADARREKESAIDAQDFEKAASLRDREKQLVGQRAEREKQWRSGDLDVVAEVDDEQIAEVLGNWTGIPVFKLTEAETTRLLRMEDELHKRIIGQEDAVKAVSKAIRRTRAGLKDPKRPSGSFIFAGPSGVGKTELSKALANFLFGDDDALIQIDMGEFHDRFTASRLFGAPPGYVGYEEGGQLTEKVRRKPFSVVLFDEIEKAHQEIYNSLLQVLEDGRLTDGQGRTVDFKNTVLIFTSNLGTSDISKAVGLGFTQGGGENNYERMKQKVNDELKKHFRPEFLNRIDDIIVFHQLTREEIIEMVDLMIGRVGKQLKTKDMAMELTDKAKSLLAKRGFDPVLGARPLRRTIQREIEDQLSEKILFDEIGPGQLSRSTWTTGTAKAPEKTWCSPSREPASRPKTTWLPPVRMPPGGLRSNCSTEWPATLCGRPFVLFGGLGHLVAGFDVGQLPVSDCRDPGDGEKRDDRQAGVVEVDAADPTGDRVDPIQVVVQYRHQFDRPDQHRDGDRKTGDREVVVDLPDRLHERPVVGHCHQQPVQGVHQAHSGSEEQRYHQDGVPGQTRGRAAAGQRQQRDLGGGVEPETEERTDRKELHRVRDAIHDRPQQPAPEIRDR